MNPKILFATIYPPNPAARSELFTTELLLKEYLKFKPAFDLSVLIVSAHPTPLDEARELMAQYPSIPARFTHIKTRYAGHRPEEISYCKEQLSKQLAREDFDYLLFMDADVWTAIRQVPKWIHDIGSRLAHRFVKIKYCLKDRMSSPAHTLGAYFHHKELLLRTSYWKSIFPKKPNGTRRGAPDCCLHDYLIQQGCHKIVPNKLLTYHFINKHDANVFSDGLLSNTRNARHEIANSPLELEHPLEPGSRNKRPAIHVGEPLVSAVMITGKNPDRMPLAKIAIQCFQRQTYQNKELVIINTDRKPVCGSDKRVREIMVNYEDGFRLGDLRNLGLILAKGDWIIQWDDDDWYGDNRIAVQMETAESGAANLISSQIRYDFKNNSAFVYRVSPGIDGTILHERNNYLRYPGTALGEDSEFLKQFSVRNVSPTDPGLYVRMCHTANTRTSKHIMHDYVGLKNRWELSDGQATLLRETVLPQYDLRSPSAKSALPLGTENLLSWTYQRTSSDRGDPKVFIIGLSDDPGLRDIDAKLETLGIRIAIEPESVHEVECSAGASGWVPTCYYRQLDNLFPNSIFICYKPAKSRFQALCRQSQRDSSPTRNAPTLAKNAVLGLGRSGTDKEKGVPPGVYDRFYREVKHHFKQRASQLIWLENETDLLEEILKVLTSHSVLQGEA